MVYQSHTGIKALHVIETFCMGGAQRIAVSICAGFPGSAVCYYQAYNTPPLAFPDLLDKYCIKCDHIPRFEDMVRKFKYEQFDILHIHWCGDGITTDRLTNWDTIRAERIPYIISSHSNTVFPYKHLNLICEAESQYKMQKCETKLIYNGLDDSDAFVYDREYPQKDKIVIGFVSRLDDKLGVKAPVKMCDAVSTMNKAFKFVVIGDGLRRSSFVDVFKQRKVEFEMLGNRDDISECLKDLDIFLYPTQADNFPTVVTEAMLSGLPIVAPPIGDIPFMLADGRGYAIEWEEMPDVMKVLSGNHKKRQIVGNRAKQFAMSGFSHETMIKSYEEEYVKIIHDTNKEYYSMSDDNDCLTEPTVSVVVPTYRRPNEAYRCVQYLLKQDLPVEIVVVNDGDCESDYSKVKALPVKYIQLQSNHGLSAARNIGIKAAKGQYIGFCDDDDRWYPSFARRLALELKRKGASVVYGVGFGVRGTQVVDKIDLRMFDEPFDGKELYCRNFIAMPATMIRKSVLVEVGGFDEAMHQNGMSGPEDLELWIRLMLAGHKFVRCAFIGLVYNMGEERFTTTTVNNGAMAKGMRYIADKHKVELGYTDSKGKNFCEVDNDE